MKTIFRYQNKEYSYMKINGEVITFRVNKDIREDDIMLDEELQEELEAEFEVYEATLNEEEMRTWKGE